MKIYRGLKDILFKNINPFHINKDNHTYGEGTSYATERFLAEEYCNSICVKNYGWILTYSFNPKNPYYVKESDYVDLENFGESTDMFYNKEIIDSKDFASLLRKDGYDCAIFDHDENDPHVLILDNNINLELDTIELFSENQEIVNFVSSFKIPFDGTNFIVPPDLLKIIDDFLETI